MFGIEGTRPTRDSVSLLKETGACGVLLLARNIESPAQLRRLTAELQQRVGRPLLFSIDHEGGWVLRFSQGVTAFPGNACLGKAGSTGLAYQVGRQMALELRAMGVRLNLAPVVDVLTAKYNPGVGIRSFGEDPALVGRLGSAMIRGMQDHGVSACAKHFPGKGAATKDAHQTLPTIRLPRGLFARRHLAPFADAVEAGVDCVMSSHVCFPSLDKDDVPATFSRKITHALLRRRLGFDGVVISDDLCMGAITERWPIQEAAIEALAAGHDILLIAHAREAQREAVELLAQALAEGRVPKADFQHACRRVQALLDKRRDDARASWTAPDSKGAQALSLQVAQAAVEKIRPGSVKIPLELRPDSRLALICPDFRQVRELFTFEGGPARPAKDLLQWTKRWPGRRRVLASPILGDEARARRVAREAGKAEIVIFFCFEAMRFEGQAQTLKTLQRRFAKKLIVVLIRSSSDASLLKHRVAAIDAHGYRRASMQAALRFLRGG